MINPALYWLLFLKASLFSTGGFSNLPSLHQDLLAKGWATEVDFGRSIAIGQISPGPNGLWVISLGYFTYGVPGAVFALIAITLPPLLVLVIAAQFGRIERRRWTQGAMHGISLAVLGLLVTVIWTILHQPGVDWKGVIIAAASLALSASHKVNLLIILLLGGYVTSSPRSAPLAHQPHPPRMRTSQPLWDRLGRIATVKLTTVGSP